MKAILNTIAFLLLCGTNSLAQFPPLIDAQKDAFYSQRTDSTHGYIHIPHTEFIPLSGARPDGESDLSADVWVAWDEEYFYLYAEVKDDVVQVSSAVRPWNDCIELKFDPDPSRKPLTGIVNARLTAQDIAEADLEKGVDNLYPEKDSLLSQEASHPSNYARRKTNDGYALELRLAWNWIRTKDRGVRVGVGNVFGLAINIHDNDGSRKPFHAMERDGSIQWSAGMADEVWLVPQLLGTIEFLPDHRLTFIRRNTIDSSDVRATTFLSRARFTFRDGYLIQIENWRYHSGDDPAWANPLFNDSQWEVTHAGLRARLKPLSGWNGIGWFRTQLVVDSSLVGVPLGVYINHTGASEVFLDGTVLLQIGRVGNSASDEVGYLERNIKPIVFQSRGVHTLAVRYSNFSLEYLNKAGISGGISCGFFYDLGKQIAGTSEAVRALTMYQVVFVLLPVMIGAMHLFFFAFYPRGKENVFFALFMFCWAYVVFNDYQGSSFATDIIHAVAMGRVGVLAIGGALIFGLLTIYSAIYQKLPTQFYALVVAVAGITIWGFLESGERLFAYFLYSLLGLIALEVFRVFVVQWRKRSRQKWISAIGVALFVISLLWQVLSGMEVLPAISDYGFVYAFGLLTLSICVSIDLSRSYAATTKDLERQLVQVKELSDKALEQERRAKEDEIARRMLEADNARKTKELEEARQVQLSILPKQVPNVANLEIAVKMETATEVGGDYYDFHLADDGTLTVALGDATGHGAKAGTMVSITKGLFHELAGLESLTSIFEKFTTAMKHMSLGSLYMGLLLVRIKNHKLTASAAGMPPMFLYRAGTKSVELVVMKGMPLGSFERFPYQTRELQLDRGDTLLLMSDGFIEMFNEEGETLDELRAVATFKEVADRNPKDIIDCLVREGRKWANGRPQADDVTFVAMKVKA